MHRRRILVALIACAMVQPMSAQVGHDPENSPFRPIYRSTWLEFYSGKMLGSGGPIPVGPHDGTLAGLRFDFRSRSSLQIGIGGWLADAKRNVIDANDSVATRVTPNVGQRVGGVEMTIQFNVTGGKSWRGLAPYTSLSIGFAMAQNGPASDSSGYEFGTKTFFAPAIGTRYFVGERVFLKAEARATMWKIKYPTSYSYEPVKQPGTAEFPNAVNPGGHPSDYTIAPKLILGVAWAF